MTEDANADLSLTDVDRRTYVMRGKGENEMRRRPHKSEDYDAEFLRGPYDGLEVACPRLVKALALPVSRNLVRRLGGDFGGSPSAVTTLAIYRLHTDGHHNRYVYSGFVAANRLHMEKWLI